MFKVVKIHCRKCGQAGHNAATCKKSSLMEDDTLAAHQMENQQQPQRKRKKQPVKRKSTTSLSQDAENSQISSLNSQIAGHETEPTQIQSSMQEQTNMRGIEPAN